MSNEQVVTQASETEVVDNSMYQVQINYRSGHQITQWFDKFDVDHQAGKVTGAQWRAAPGQPRIMVIGIEDIESIVQLAVAEKPVDTITG